MNSAQTENTVSLADQLLGTLDESVFFGLLSQAVKDAVSADGVVIFKSYQSGQTQQVASNGKAMLQAPILDRGVGLSGHVSRTKRPYYSNNIQRDPIAAANLPSKEVKSELCLPILVDGHVLGTINVQSHDEKRVFGEDDLKNVSTLLEDVQRPLKNMKMYLLARQLNEELLKRVEQKEQELRGRGPSSARGPEKLAKVNLVGTSSAFTKVLEVCRKVSKEDFPVLLRGDAGVGKKALALRIHGLSERRGRTARIVHCTSLNDRALQGELFGHGKAIGVLEEVNGGSIILNNVDELSLAMQEQILQTMVSGRIFPAERGVAVDINVRFLATTRRGLEELVEQGQFLHELFIRLSTIPVDVPALREREEDIRVLCEYFLNKDQRPEDMKVITSEAMDRLLDYRWPGNILELKNVMGRVRAYAEGRFVDGSHLPELSVSKEAEVQSPEEEFVEITLHELEKRHICRTLEHLGGNKTRAAKTLGITVKTLYNKLHSYGLVERKSQS